jgi:uncharacterized membrane protein YdjX (TVP38/TMEM64 family)
VPVTTRSILRGLLLIGALVGVGFLIRSGGPGGLFTREWVEANILGRGFEGQVAFLAAAAVFTAVGLPRQLAAFLGGYAFGLATGFWLSLVATAIGCSIAFYFARLVGRGPLIARFPDRLRRADAFLSENTFTATLIIRLMPVGSNFFTNLAAGLSGARAFYFIAGSALGYIPQMIVFALLGSGIHIDPTMRISLSVILFVASVALGAFLYRRYRRSDVTPVSGPAD